jgi:hypothetical protein
MRFVIYTKCRCVNKQPYTIAGIQRTLVFVSPITIRRHRSKYSETTAFTLTYLLTYLLTPWSRVLLEKLTGLQLIKKFPTFYGTRKFITAFTNARHRSLS